MRIKYLSINQSIEKCATCISPSFIDNEKIYIALSSLNGTLIEVYEGSRTSDKFIIFLIAVKFKAMSPIQIIEDF